MNWEFILVLLIPVGVWVLSSLFKSGDADDVQRRPGGQGGRPRAGSDIDRFLEEINRRRKEASERKAPPVEDIPMAEEVKLPPPRPKQLPRRRPDTPRPQRPRPTRSVPDMVELVVPEVVVPPIVVRQQPQISQPLAEGELRGPVEMPLPTPGPLSPKSLARNQAFQSLLFTPQNLRMVLVLKEVLGPPRCKRN